MIPHLFFYQLVILGLLWLFVMLSYAWPSPGVTTRTKPATPILPHRQRSNEPKPFAGLTHKPHCAACAQDAPRPQAPSPVPPEPMPATNRRPRQVDTSTHFCPHPGCDYRGGVGLGNLRANGHPNGGPWRQLHCTSCGGYVLETHGTIFHGTRVPVDLIVHVLACVAEGLGIRGTARVFEVDPNTVLPWLMEAAEQLRAFSSSFLGDVHIRQRQLDALFAVLSAVKAGEVTKAQAIKRWSRSPHWVWPAIDPESQ